MELHKLYEKQTIREILKSDFEKYDLICLIEDENFLAGLIEQKVLNKKVLNKKVLLYVEEKVDINSSVDYRRLSEDEKQQLLDLYFTYEFSDKFCVIKNNPFCGNLQNYVELGVMSKEEAYQALIM